MSKTHKIIVFHIGHLGDTLMIIPALKTLKKNYPTASFTFLADKVLGTNHVVGSNLFNGLNYFDKIVTFPKVNSPIKGFANPILALKTIFSMRRYKYDAVAYLVPSTRWPKQIKRDRLVFQAAGIKTLLGFKGFDALKEKNSNPNSLWLHEADTILQRLALDGLNTPPLGKADVRLDLTSHDHSVAESFFSEKFINHQSKLMVGFGPGTKMQAKKWPFERFAEVGKQLIYSHDIWPVVFGGPEDKKMGDELLKRWKRGSNAAGYLGLREAAAALSKCDLYIGNDTGTMHLAASVATPCVAIFSSRDLNGKWHPYGRNHFVFREQLHCSGCKREFCSHKSCLMKISPQKVIKVSRLKLSL